MTNKVPDSMLANGLGGGAAARVAASNTIPLDTAGSGKAMPLTAGQTIAIAANFTPVLGAGAVEGGVCVVDYLSDATHGPNLSAWVAKGDSYAAEANRKWRFTYAIIGGDAWVIVSKGGYVAAPVFTAQSAPVGAVGVAYSYTFVASGATSYALASGTLPSGLTLNTATGVLSGTPTTASAYTFVVSATNAYGTTNSTSQSVTITSGGAAPVFSAQSAPAGQVGIAYTYTFVASNTTSFAVASGTLPAGLALNTATGVLSGTPTTATAYTFVIAATGPGGTTNSTSQSVTIIVPAPVFSAQSAPGGQIGLAYSYSFVASNTTSYAVFSGSLPAGLSLSSGGALTGTPSGSPGTATFVVRATGAGGVTDSTSQSVVIAPAATGRADNFNRADAGSLGTPSDGGSAWVTDGAVQIVGNKAVLAGNTFSDYAAYHPVMLAAATPSADQTVTITGAGFGGASGPGTCGPAARMVDTSNYLLGRLDADGSWQINKMVAGVESNINYAASGITDFTTIPDTRLITSGTGVTLQAFETGSWVTKLAVTSSDFAGATGAGIHFRRGVSGTACSVNDFSAA